MQEFRKRKQIKKRLLLATSLLCCLLLIVLLLNFKKFYAKFIYRGNLQGKVVVPSKSALHAPKPNSNVNSLPLEATEFVVTYDAGEGYYNDDITNKSNIVKYLGNNIEEGTYLVPKFSSGSFRKWYTSSNFEEGTEFNINNYNGPDITVYAKSEDIRALLYLRELNKKLKGTYLDKTYKDVITAIKQESALPEWLPEEWVDIDQSIYITNEYHLIYIEKTSSENTPMIFWFTCDDNILHWYSDDPNPIIIYEDTNDDFGFNGFTSLSDISGIENWDVSRLENMNGFFADCTNLSDISPIRYWNVSNVKSMNSTFSNMLLLSSAEAINNWNITNVTSFTNMFKGTSVKPIFNQLAGEFDLEGTFIPTIPEESN